MSEIPFPGVALVQFKVEREAHECKADEYPFVVWVDRSPVGICQAGCAAYKIDGAVEEGEFTTEYDESLYPCVCLCMGIFLNDRRVN